MPTARIVVVVMVWKLLVIFATLIMIKGKWLLTWKPAKTAEVPKMVPMVPKMVPCGEYGEVFLHEQLFTRIQKRYHDYQYIVFDLIIFWLIVRV